MHCDFRLARKTDVDRASLEATETARHPTEFWMSVITYVSSHSSCFVLQGRDLVVDKRACISSCVATCHVFTATHLQDLPPPWAGAPVLDPQMFTTPAGGENDEMIMFD